MVSYIDPDGNYPRHAGDIMFSNPFWRIGDELPAGWEVVEDTDIPMSDVGYQIILSEPKKVNGIWKQDWASVAIDTDIWESHIKAIEDEAARKLNPTIPSMIK